MATTVNNTTANSRITIVFDSDTNPSNQNDGPRSGTGNTESDVLIDNESYLNIRSHTEIDSNIHALQWDAKTNTGTLEYIDTRDNESLNSFPQWATNVVIRVEAQNIWSSTYNSTYDAHSDAGAEDDSAAVTAATNAANTARTDYLAAHSITF